MRKLLLIPIIALIAFSAALSHAQANNPQLTGTIAYRERMALPTDAVIDVQLLDTSIADVAAQTVAEVLINAEGRQVPVPFTLSYDPAKIDAAHRYSVRSTIRSGDGMLMFSSTQAYPVLTHGASSKVNLLLHTVGHGAKPGAAAKKATTPAAAESAAASQAVTAAASSNEPVPSAVAPSAPESDKPAAVPESKPVANDTSSSETAPPLAESPATATRPDNAPPVPEPAPAPPATTEQAARPAEAAGTAGPGGQPESKPAEALSPTPEPAIPSESKTEPTTPAPESNAAEPAASPSEAKSAEREAPLPEAPSASKGIESAPPPPEGDIASGKDSTSRPERPAANKALTPLADTQWKLIQLHGQDVVITPPQKPVTLSFSPEGKRMAGLAGCNSYLGSFRDDHGHLELHPGSMTMMACAEPASSREQKFVDMLRSANGYKLSGGFLLLTTNGKTVAKFKNNQE